MNITCGDLKKWTVIGLSLLSSIAQSQVLSPPHLGRNWLLDSTYDSITVGQASPLSGIPPGRNWVLDYRYDSVTCDNCTGGGVTSVTASAPILSSGGSTPNISIPVATSIADGYLSHIDWSTFNGKQPAGNYITALTGDVTATGPGSVTSLVSPLASKVYVHLALGSDSTGTGSALHPWKTIQHTCNSISPSINVPVVIHVEGGNNDTDTYPITCPANIVITADYGLQLHGITISGGTLANDGVFINNIIFVDKFTWIRNDVNALTLTFMNVLTFAGVDFEQQGSGVSQSAFTAIGANTSLFGGITLEEALTVMQSAGVISGTFNYKDSGGSALLFITACDLFSLTLNLNGGIFAELSGNIADSGYTITGTTTASGTPTLMSDAGSVPADSSITGSITKLPNSQSSWENYTPTTAAQWSTVPATVHSALDAVRILSQSASASQPACTSANRGLEWLVDGASGVADVYQICQKTVADTYVWTTH